MLIEAVVRVFMPYSSYMSLDALSGSGHLLS